MNNYKLKRIAREGDSSLRIEFSDGMSALISLEKFREACPCAECMGEFSGKKKKMHSLNIFRVGMNELKSLSKVGNYAVQPVWGDGHDTGIYTLELLRQLCSGQSGEKPLTTSEINKN